MLDLLAFFVAAVSKNVACCIRDFNAFGHLFQMPNEALSHEENLHRICFCHLGKIKRGEERSLDSQVTRKDGSTTTFKQIIIDLKIYENLERDAPFLPKSLCPNGVRILHSQFAPVKRKVESHHWEELANDVRDDLEDFPPSSGEHVCHLCFLAKEQGKKLTKSHFCGDQPKPKRRSNVTPTCKYCHLELPRSGTHYCKKERRNKAIYDSISPEGRRNLQLYLDKKCGPSHEAPKVEVKSGKNYLNFSHLNIKEL